MATPSRDRQASPAHSEGTQTRHLPVWTCPDMAGLKALHNLLSKSFNYRNHITPFNCPHTSFGPATPTPPGTPTKIQEISSPAPDNNTIPHQRPVNARNQRLGNRTSTQPKPPDIRTRNRSLRLRTTPPPLSATDFTPIPTPTPQVEQSPPPTPQTAHVVQEPNSTKCPTSLKATLLNTWSLNKHALTIRDYITTNNLDFMAITETWLTEASGPTLETAIPKDYTIKHVDRPDKKGGGVAIIHRQSIPFYIAKSEQINRCESILLKVSPNPSNTINILLIYRPPQDMPLFAHDLTQRLSPLIKSNTANILLGDMNYGRNDPKDKKAQELEKALKKMNFSVKNSDPSHNKGRTLDWVASQNCTVNITSTENCIWSDHSAINFNVEIPGYTLPEANPPKSINIRNLKKITPELLNKAVQDILLATTDRDHPDVIMKHYDEVLSSLLEKAAPRKNKVIRISRRATKWFSEKLKESLAKKRKAEKTWRNSKQDADKSLWKELDIQYKREITLAKKNFYQKRIEEADNKSKELFGILKELEKPIKEPPAFIPSNDDCIKTQAFFANKIKIAREKIIASSKKDERPDNTKGKAYSEVLDPADEALLKDPGPLPNKDSPRKPPPFSFNTVSIETVIKTLKKMKPCPEKCDPFPSKIIINNAQIFAPILTRIINSSFLHNTIPLCLKTVCVTPIPKKANSDQKDPTNLRPITNVRLILKLLDKLATAQFQSHIDSRNLLHEGQSGFRKGYSTETALLQLMTQLRKRIEENKAALLILLDLSAAYDLVDHHILIQRIKNKFQCSPSACSWILSFLSERQSKVTWNTAESPVETLKFGVPQGSCISPALFNTYMTPLFQFLEKEGVIFTNYADDTQLLLELTGDHKRDTDTLNHTYNLIKKWMDENWMCLNGTKTELIIISSKHKRTKLGTEYDSFQLHDTTIPVAKEVKTLGVTIDAHLTMSPHCNKIYNTSQYFLKLLRGIRPVLSEDLCATIARATISSRLDYCNALLTNTKIANIQKLQLVQNEAVRIISKIPKREHITAARQALHWLPIDKRIQFKALAITHKCRTGNAPIYLCDHIKPINQSRTLRSNNANLLQCPMVKKECGGRSSFSFTGPAAWNQLPPEIRQEKSYTTFKKLIKTVLFC